MIRRNGQLEEATWDEAYDCIVENLGRIKAEHGPQAIGGISSARCTNEENYLMQKFMRAVVGSNNIDKNSGETNKALGCISDGPRNYNSFCSACSYHFSNRRCSNSDEGQARLLLRLLHLLDHH